MEEYNMEEQKKRSFGYLKKLMDKKEFLKFCKKVAMEYATSPYEYARSYITTQYNITPHCYYQILDNAIIEGLVDEKMVYLMEQKALENQKAHMSHAGMTTRKHYSDLRKLRKENSIVNMYSNEDLKKIATEFAFTDFSVSECAQNLNVSIRIYTLILEKAIIELLVDDNVYEAIKKRSIERAPSDEAKRKSKNFFKQLTRKRNSKKKELAIN